MADMTDQLIGNIPKAYPVSNAFLGFCIRNNITEEELDVIFSSPMSKNIRVKDVNYLLWGYVVGEERYYSDVCIKDIVGQDPNAGISDLNGILLYSYSDPGCGTYHWRDNDKLDLPIDEMVEEIKLTTKRDDIVLRVIDESRFLIDCNGCHRSAMLRFLYIYEVLKGQVPIEELNKKYTISCNIKKPDFILTYINYILIESSVINRIYTYFLDQEPGQFKIEFINKEEKIMTRQEIIDYFVELVSSNKLVLSDSLINSIKYNAMTIPSFKQFIIDYIPSLEHVIKEDENGRTS